MSLNCEDNSSITDWKRLWQLVSGIHYATSEETVKETLFNVSKELQDGILQFKTSSTSTKTLESILKEKKQEKLISFTNKLQQLLNLESNQCWEILCYYLTNEYRGTANTLTSLTSTESNMIKLLDDIWGYYTLERMIVLKVVKNMLEFYKNSLNPYHKEYKEVLDKITIEKLKTSYLNQFEYLVKELPPTKLTANEFTNYQTKLIDWRERNCRETIEILQILLLIVNYCGVTCDEMKKLFHCFERHLFGRQQNYLNDSNEIQSELKLRIMYCEVVLFLRCIDITESNADINWIKEVIAALDKNILSLQNCLYPEHGPLLLAWMLLNFRVIDESEDILSTRKYRQLGAKAVQLKVFTYLKDIVAHKMFGDGSLVARITRKTIYNHLSHLCELCDEDCSVSQHSGVYELMCELLSAKEIAREFSQNNDCGLRSMYNTALENFPIDFNNLSEISHALVKGGEIQFVKKQLEELPIYTELYDSNRIKLQSANDTEDDEYILLQSLTPFRGIDYLIPAGTTVAVVQKSNSCFVHFRINVNYYNVLYNEINALLSEVIQYTEIDNDRLKRVHVGLTLLSKIIENMNSPSEIVPEMVHPTEMCIDLLNKFKNVQNPPLELLANCLNVCTALLPLFKNEIFFRIINLNICPYISNDNLDYKKYAHGMSFDSSLVGTYLINIEHNAEKYEFLVAYLKFLQKYASVNAEDKITHNKLFLMEIPGLIFLLREVFPHIHSWRFQKLDDRNGIYKLVMDYICEVLDIVSTGQNSDQNEKNILRDISVYSLLNLDNGIVLLKFIAIGNPFLQSSMEMESNWLISSSTSIIRLVRQSMKILMHLLRLKTTIFESTKLSPLETLIYTQPKQRDTLRIIPVVTSYMNNIFDQTLSILSCRLLRRIAIEFKMSLLACLDMEPDQIRLIFLQRLPDDLESDNLKIAILEFVEACIEKQPGLTQAFFKINFEQERRLFAPKERDSNIGDSIITFMKIYLISVAEIPNIVECPLPNRIMSIFHALWKNNMQSLLDDLTKQSDFWLSLCNPLFSDTYKEDIKVYSQILNVLGLELFCCRPKQTLDINLQKVLDKFFENVQLTKWLNFVFTLPKVTNNDVLAEETAEWLSRLQSFKDFTVILLKKNIQGLEIPEGSKKLLAIKCLEKLVDRAQYIDDLRPFVILAELYLIVLFSFKHNYTQTAAEDTDMLQNITKLLSSIAICYEDLHIRAKDSCLSITIKITELLAGEIIKDLNMTLKFLYPIVNIVSYELSELERTVQDELVQNKTKDNIQSSKELQKQKNTSLILSLNLLKTILSTFHNAGLTHWDTPFITNRIFNRLLSCANCVLQLSSKQKLTIELLDVLISFAKGTCSSEFLYCDISDYLWLKLLPPKELLQAPYLIQSQQQQNQPSWTAQQWWPIYSRGIELITILFKKFKYQFLKEVLLFVGIHEEYLADSMLLAKQSLETNATVLIKNTVHFISELVEFQKEWRLEHSQSLFNLMRCVQMLLGHCISLFNQQRNLKRLISGLKTQIDPVKELANDCFVDDVITAMNDLTEIISLCAKCLLQFSPSLLELLCEPQFLACNWEPLLEIRFGPPTLNDTNTQLTFGALLSIVGVFTKSLNLQGYSFHEIPLNNIPIKLHDVVDGETDSIPIQSSISLSTTLSAATGSRANYSKSVSVASVTSLSSTTAPSNEILSNLDGEMCQLALENVLTLAASQSFLALKNFNLSNREKQMIRREISTELITYHEFVRKKVLNDLREYRDIWHRKKRGLTMMLSANVFENSFTKQSDLHKRKDSLRVNVVRGLHLGRRKIPSSPQPGTSKQAFDMTQDLSPITKKSSKTSLNTPAAISSTPNLVRSSIHKNINDKSDQMSETMEFCSADDSEETQYFEPEEPKYSPLSYVTFVEEDYLHFLSNLFNVICQSD